MTRRVRLIAVGAIAIGGTVVAGAAHAQQSQTDEIIVTARKRVEALQDVPLAITAISGDELRQSSAQDITDLQRQTPSLFFADGPTDQSAVLITIRGQGQPDNFLGTGSAVGVYVDGVYYPRQIGLKSTLIDLDRVEVLKGPQGTLYGKNTTGGAINITTKRPDLNEWGGFAEATVGNYRELDFAAALNAPLVQDKVGLRLVGLSNNREGFGKNGLGRSLKNDDTIFLRGHILFQPSDEFSFLLSGDWQRIREKGNIGKLTAVLPVAPNLAALVAGVESGNPAGGFDILNGYTNGSAYRTGGTAPSGSRYDGKGVSGTATWSPGAVEVKAIVAYREFNRRSDHDYDASPFTILQGYTTTNDQFYSGEIDISGNAINDRLSWVIGGYYDHEDGDEASFTTALAPISPVNPQIIDGSSKAESWAVFGQGTFALTDRLNLTAGLRWSEETRSVEARDRIILQPGGQEVCNVPPGIRDNPAVCLAHASKKFSDYTYLLSLDYHFTPDVMVYAKTSRGFRSGGIKGVNTTADAFVTFDPEVATDYEVGAKTTWLNKKLVLNFAAYKTKYKDIQRAIVIATPSGTFTTQIRNAAKATINGFEVEAVVRPTQWFTLSGTAGYTDATYDKFFDLTGDRSGEKFPVPKWTYSLSGQFHAPVASGELRLQADWSWRSGVVFEPTARVLRSVSQGSYGLLNARLSYVHQTTGIEVALFGRNLLNRTYRASALALTPLGFNVAYTGDPRTYGVQIRVPFGSEK